MTVKQTAAIASGAALIVSGTVLGLLWRFGVWCYMQVGQTDLRVIVWPSSVMLTSGWCKYFARNPDHHVFRCNQLLVVHRHRVAVARFAPSDETGSFAEQINKS
jgi:hypothetical protein